MLFNLPSPSRTAPEYRASAQQRTGLVGELPPTPTPPSQPSPCRYIDLLTTVQVKPWKLEEGDTTLLDLIPFLEAVCSARQMDVREIISTYKGQDIPTAFR